MSIAAPPEASCSITSAVRKTSFIKLSTGLWNSELIFILSKVITNQIAATNKTRSQIFWSSVIYNAMHHYCFTNWALMDKFRPL